MDRQEIKIGQKFARLTVLRETNLPLAPSQIKLNKKTGIRAAVLSCECGKEITATISGLYKGRVLSCGCLKAERLAKANTKKGTHGLSSHELYSTWVHMVKRCTDESTQYYANYGGRGIKVFEDWLDATIFIAYIEKELGKRPKGFSLDRIDNDGNYEPGNVKWSSAGEQARNRRPKTNTAALYTFKNIPPLKDVDPLSKLTLAHSAAVAFSLAEQDLIKAITEAKKEHSWLELARILGTSGPTLKRRYEHLLKINPNLDIGEV